MNEEVTKTVTKSKVFTIFSAIKGDNMEPGKYKCLGERQ